jgi:hypothetical protein
MENQLLTLLQLARDEGDESARSELNHLLRNDPQARKTMAKLLIDEQALIGHLRDESIVSLLDPAEQEKVITSLPPTRMPLRPIGAAVAAGLVLGMICMSVAFGYVRPKSVVTYLPLAHGNFDSLPLGPIESGFSSRFGQWSGDPVDVIEEADGNQRLCFMETGNVKGDPKGGASASNAFQFIDLAALRNQWQSNDPGAQQTLELSVNFERKPSSTDGEYPKLRADCRIYLFDTDPEAIVEGWPHVLTDVVAIGKKMVRLKPGEKSGNIIATCLLEPEAAVALITLGVGVGMHTNTPIELANYYADDVQLSLTTHPKLPVQFAK